MHEQEQSNNKLTRQDYDKINEAIIRKNPALARLDERIIYDKEFLLEVQSHGYNPLDKEDVQNFLEKKPPKDLNRNLTLCGAGTYNSLGQSEYEDIDVAKFGKKTGLSPTQKKPEDIYLSDIPNKKAKDYLIEAEGIHDVESTIKESKKLEIKGNPKHLDKASEDIFRKHMAKAFGDDMKKSPETSEIENYSTEVVKSSVDAEKLLELIKEYRALGFTPEEIKKEIQRFH
jgi:hypothetical protein